MMGSLRISSIGSLQRRTMIGIQQMRFMSPFTLGGPMMTLVITEIAIPDQSSTSLQSNQLVDTSRNTMKDPTLQEKTLGLTTTANPSLAKERRPLKTHAIEHQFMTQ